MQFTNYLKSFGLLFFACLFMASCEKDSTLLETKEEVVEPGVNMTIGTRTITTDAFALYCDENGKEGLSVSNREDLLDGTINSQDYEEGDFLFTYVADGTGTYSTGGGFFDAETIGTSFSQFILTNLLDITIDSNDGESVVGSMEGTILALDDNLELTIELPVSVVYNATVIGTSDICD